MSRESNAEDTVGVGHPPLCFVVMPFGVKPDGQGGSVDFDAVYADLLAPAIRAAESGAAARRPGPGRGDDPQADVRAADPGRLRGRRPHDRERERLLRARRPPRRAPVLDRARQRRCQAGAVRPRSRPRPSLRPRRARRPGESGGRSRRPRGGPACGARRGDRQPRVPAHRRAPGAADRPPEDRRLPRPGGLLRRAQGAPRRRPSRGGRVAARDRTRTRPARGCGGGCARRPPALLPGGEGLGGDDRAWSRRCRSPCAGRC